MFKPRPFPLILLACALLSNASAQTNPQRIRVAVLDFGETQTGKRAAAKLSLSLLSSDQLLLADREESGAAARGAGYNGSLNMTLQEARDLGGAIGSDLYVTGDAQTLRRSSSTRPVYYEAYASVFVVSARTGRLAMWDRPSFEAATPEEAEQALLRELEGRAKIYASAIERARESERAERAQVLERVGAPVPVIEDVPEDEAAAEREGLRLPQPYRRLRPPYPETAERADAEATVDVQVEIDAEGEVSRVEVVRWAGFGLDEATISTVRQLHFRPARRDGRAVPMRVLLRYNFRRPPKEGKR
ncbi:MAG TPA: energy transducer TonB [Pyrinomonadaceae bacterium]|nr:energy transducer TonB [Pyrinomonadaceae bacterium]